MRFPITATIESARFSARNHSTFQTVKSGRRWEFASRGAVEKWGHFIMGVLHEGTKKRGTLVRLSLYVTFVILLLGHRQQRVSLCRCLI